MVPSVMAAIDAAKLVQAIVMLLVKKATRALRRVGPTAGLAAAGGLGAAGGGGAAAGGVAVTPSAAGGEGGVPGDSGLFWIESDMISGWLPINERKAGT